MINHFKLSSALIAIRMYEDTEQNFHKKLLSTTFSEELQEEAKLIGCNPIPECTITFKLKWSSIEDCTVKEFEKTIKNLFLDYTQDVHLFKVYDGGCTFATMCAPKPLMRGLVTMGNILEQYCYRLEMKLSLIIREKRYIELYINHNIG